MRRAVAKICREVTSRSPRFYQGTHFATTIFQAPCIPWVAEFNTEKSSGDDKEDARSQMFRDMNDCTYVVLG